MNKVLHLEGLRGLAAFVVVLAHVIHPFILDLNATITHSLGTFVPHKIARVIGVESTLFVESGIAVRIFWTLSAYVISIKLFTSSPQNKFTHFITGTTKRYVRLLIPCCISILFSYILLRTNCMFNLKLAAQFMTDHINNNWLMSQYTFEPNLFIALKSAVWDTFFNYNPATTYNKLLWTMEYELLGSLLCFALFSILEKNNKRFIIYGIIGLTSILTKKYWLLCFLSGYVLSDFDYSLSNSTKIKNIKKFEITLINNKITTLLILLFFFLIPIEEYFLGLIKGMSDDTIAIMIGIFTVYFVLRLHVLISFLSKRIFVLLGKISFSLYLVHLPIVCSFTCWFYLYIHSGLAGIILSIVSTILICLIISYYFQIIIDKRSIRISNKISELVKKNLQLIKN